MSWYENSKSNQSNQIDKSRPIKATNGCDIYLLMPVTHGGGGYTIIGYDWFSVNGGIWNSCRKWPTIEDAIKNYKEFGYIISNTSIELK